MSIHLRRAILDDLHAITEMLETVDPNVFDRRRREWTDNHLRAPAYDPDRTSAPNVVDEEGIPIPSRSDPTPAAALQPAGTDYRKAVVKGAANLRAMRLVVAELTRPGTADDIDHAAAEPLSTVPKGSGACRGCAARCTGLPNDRLRRSACPKCYQRCRRAERETGRDWDDTLESIRAERGLDLNTEGAA